MALNRTRPLNRTGHWNRTIPWALGALAVILVGVGIPAPEKASAQRAQVYLTQHRVPGRLSEGGLIRFVRGHQARRLHETNEPELEDREWKAEMLVAFRRPPGDLEFQVLFYDIEDARRFVDSMNIYVNDRDQKTYLQRIRLDREKFEPNTRYEAVVTVRRQEVGRVRFDLIGEEDRNSGEVSFSDAEASGRPAQPQPEPEPEPAPDEPLPEQEYEPADDNFDAEDPTAMPVPVGAGMEQPPEAGQSEAGRSGGLCSATPGSVPSSPLGLALFGLVALGVLFRRSR